MHALWHWLLYLLTWASHDPATLAAERARCAGAVVVAYAALAQEPTPAPKREADHSADAGKMVPAPPQPVVPERVAPKQPFGKEKLPVLPTEPSRPCPQCHDTGRIYRSDGGWVRCSCGACSTRRCPTAR
jgi:hypothetical protein